MRERCGNPNRKSYANYGGRGITVCERWRTFDLFLADMGERPDGATIDRVDGTRGYEPGNCRWATMAVQQRNRRSSKLEAHEPAQVGWLRSLGVSKDELSEFFGVSRSYVKALAWQHR